MSCPVLSYYRPRIEQVAGIAALMAHAVQADNRPTRHFPQTAEATFELALLRLNEALSFEPEGIGSDHPVNAWKDEGFKLAEFLHLCGNSLSDGTDNPAVDDITLTRLIDSVSCSADSILKKLGALPSEPDRQCLLASSPAEPAALYRASYALSGDPLEVTAHGEQDWRFALIENASWSIEDLLGGNDANALARRAPRIAALNAVVSRLSAEGFEPGDLEASADTVFGVANWSKTEVPPTENAASAAYASNQPTTARVAGLRAFGEMAHAVSDAVDAHHDLSTGKFNHDAGARVLADRLGHALNTGDDEYAHGYLLGLAKFIATGVAGFCLDEHWLPEQDPELTGVPAEEATLERRAAAQQDRALEWDELDRSDAVASMAVCRAKSEDEIKAGARFVNVMMAAMSVAGRSDTPERDLDDDAPLQWGYDAMSQELQTHFAAAVLDARSTDFAYGFSVALSAYLNCLFSGVGNPAANGKVLDFDPVTFLVDERLCNPDAPPPALAARKTSRARQAVPA